MQKNRDYAGRFPLYLPRIFQRVGYCYASTCLSISILLSMNHLLISLSQMAALPFINNAHYFQWESSCQEIHRVSLLWVICCTFRPRSYVTTFYKGELQASTMWDWVSGFGIPFSHHDYFGTEEHEPTVPNTWCLIPLGCLDQQMFAVTQNNLSKQASRWWSAGMLGVSVLRSKIKAHMLALLFTSLVQCSQDFISLSALESQEFMTVSFHPVFFASGFTHVFCSSWLPVIKSWCPITVLPLDIQGKHIHILHFLESSFIPIQVCLHNQHPDVSTLSWKKNEFFQA